jgi:hypothetical protein
LFAQELTRAFVELRGGGDERVPATLRDSLMARLDRLGDAKGVAQIASVFGREFEFAALASLTSMAPVQLDDALERLLQMQLVRKPTGDGERFYSFAHALLQEEAYESLAKTRRVELHRGVASLMQESASRGGDVLPELMAHHLARAGESLAACDAWLRAAEHARTRCAFAEALAHLRNAENEAPRMADHGAAAAQQLRIQLQIGATVLLQHGPQSEQVEQSMAKSRELASALDAGAGLFQATWGLYLHAAAQLKLDSARRYGIELISISERLDDDDLRMEALHHRWGIAYFFGDVAGIVEHTNTAFARYERQRHHRFAHVFGGHDLGACAHCVHAVAAVLTGHPEAMREQSELGIALAESLEHPVSLAFALASICATHWIAGDLDGSALYAQRLLRVAKRYALTLQCEFAEFMLSLFESSRGDARSGAAAVEKLFPTTRRQGFFSVFPTVAFVDVLARADRHDAALELIEHTLKALPSRQTGLFVSELWRQRGELRVCSDGTLDAAAERDLRIAIDIAQAQGAALFRLRGELSLARLLTRNRRAAEARTVLAAADASRMASEVPEVAELRAATAALFAG